jgi:hypothetical protein
MKIPFRTFQKLIGMYAPASLAGRIGRQPIGDEFKEGERSINEA